MELSGFKFKNQLWGIMWGESLQRYQNQTDVSTVGKDLSIRETQSPMADFSDPLEHIKTNYQFVLILFNSSVICCGHKKKK